MRNKFVAFKWHFLGIYMGIVNITKNIHTHMPYLYIFLYSQNVGMMKDQRNKSLLIAQGKKNFQ